MTVQFYINKFQALKPDKSSGHAKPHKVCLLLAVIVQIEQGFITTNKVIYNDNLKSRFTYYFEQLQQGNDKDTPYLPFYHLQTSGFWHLDVKPEYQQEFSVLKTASNSNISRCVNFAYFDEELFDYLKSPIMRPALKDALIHNLDSLEVQYQRWALSIGKSEKTVKNYVGALKGSISNWLYDAGISKENILSIGSYAQYSVLSSKALQVEEFRAKNSKGNGMYSAALKSYQSFLADVTQVNVKDDIDKILKDENTTATEKSTLVNTRIGQGAFRDKLVQYWQGCALTRYNKMQFLIASHIKPWASADDKERLDPNNGLLLLANIDKAFDLGYITFTEKGKIVISPYLDDYQVLGISKNMGVNLNQQHQDYLAYHREIAFKK
mgnify:CR=1 FL=1